MAEKIKIAILGASGRMGQILSHQFAADDRFEIVARVDARIIDDKMEPAMIASLSNAPQFDVLVDFSAPAATAAALETMRARRAAWIVATTGIQDDLRAQILELSKESAIFIASNTSLGVALMQHLCKMATAILLDWDTEIVEVHHRNKVDAPSGTALTLAKSIAGVHEAAGFKADIVTERASRRMQRPEHEIGVSSVRGGTVAGEHTVSWYGAHEQLQIRHVAESREIFGNGARRIAAWIASKPAGLYDMQQMLDDIL